MEDHPRQTHARRIVVAGEEPLVVVSDADGVRRRTVCIASCGSMAGEVGGFPDQA
jgi:hypothetical protein